MSTFKQLQDDVLDLCQEIQGKADFTLGRVKRLLNRGQVDFCRKTKCLETNIIITTVANQQEYGYADMANLQYLIGVQHVRYVQSSSDVGDVLKPYPGGWAALPKTFVYGTPNYYWIRKIMARQGFVIGTWPVISTSDLSLVVYGVTLPTSEMSGDASYPQIADQYHEAIMNYAVWRAFELYGHEKPEWRNKALIYKNYYEDAVNECLLDSTEIEAENAIVQDVYGDY